MVPSQEPEAHQQNRTLDAPRCKKALRRSGIAKRTLRAVASGQGNVCCSGELRVAPIAPAQNEQTSPHNLFRRCTGDVYCTRIGSATARGLASQARRNLPSSNILPWCIPLASTGASSTAGNAFFSQLVFSLSTPAHVTCTCCCCCCCWQHVRLPRVGWCDFLAGMG